MLVLTRRQYQHIVFDIPGREEPIVVSVCKVQGPDVRIGIVAEKAINIYRAELKEGCAERLTAAMKRNEFQDPTGDTTHAD